LALTFAAGWDIIKNKDRTMKKSEPSGKKILVIEDDPFLGDIYETKLKQNGYSVQIAATGEDGLLYLKDKKFDVLLLDIVLPKMDGWEVLNAIKQDRASGANPNLDNLKIIILSNLGQKEEIEKGLGLGADGFMIKAHFTPSQIVEEIKNTINNPKKTL
jgi:CheY-like chemotaxis protein